MPSDEEKEAAGQEKAENENPEQALVDQGSAGLEPEGGSEGQYSSSVMPLSGDETAEQEAAAGEPEEEEEVEDTAAGKKEKKFWLLSLGLILLLLVGGGFYAVTGMRQAAHKLGGGSTMSSFRPTAPFTTAAGAARNANANYFLTRTRPGAGQRPGRPDKRRPDPYAGGTGGGSQRKRRSRRPPPSIRGRASSDEDGRYGRRVRRPWPRNYRPGLRYPAALMVSRALKNSRAGGAGAFQGTAP